MRVLIATEGPSDEIVSTSIIRSQIGDCEIVKKRFAARGFGVVKRSITTITKAAHFGGFDLLVVHFDLNGSAAVRSVDCVLRSPRHVEIREAIANAQANLQPVAQRPTPVNVALMAPAPTTDAWLSWGTTGGKSGPSFEQMNRHTLKSSLFDSPPVAVVEKTNQMIEPLEQSMESSESDWPHSLRCFVNQLRTPVPASDLTSQSK